MKASSRRREGPLRRALRAANTRALSVGWRICVITIALAAALGGTAAVTATPAVAGSYVINDCPDAGSMDAGPWTVYGSPQNAKGTCDGANGWIGPQGSSMSEGSVAGVQVSTPADSGITITEATVWWQVAAETSGGTVFAVAADNDGAVYESITPTTDSQPDTWALPSSTTELTLAAYCSEDDYGQGCTMGGGENPILELYGARLTLLDSTLPSGTITGGTLAGTGSISGTASIAWDTSDDSSGVRRVELQVGGETVAETSYAADCSYTTFQACPADESDALSWDTANVTDGKHELDVVVEDAAQNTTVIYTGQIETKNAPAALTAPSISGEAETGSTLTGTPATFSAPEGAGALSAIAGQWLHCSDAEGKDCAAINGASSSTYAPTSADVGQYLVYQSTASDADGSTSSDSPPTLAVSEPSKQAASNGGQTSTGDAAGAAAGGAVGGAGGTGSPSSSGSSGALSVDINSLGGTLLGSTTPWQIVLKTNHKRVHKGSRILLTGVVSTSPRPPKGKIVYLRARSVGHKRILRHGRWRTKPVYGKWITFAVEHTNASGMFSAKHRFRLGGSHVYEFQALAPQEGGFLNTAGASHVLTVRELPGSSLSHREEGRHR